MSKVSLDLKQFQHIGSDDKTTTLRHKHGHELTIAHKALSPEMRTQLEALAKVAKETIRPDSGYGKVTHKMAEGGETNRNPEAETTTRPDKGYGSVTVIEAEGGSVSNPKKTGNPDSVPESDTSQYDQTISNGWKNIKGVFKANGGKIQHYAEAGEVEAPEEEQSNAPADDQQAAPQSQPDPTQDQGVLGAPAQLQADPNMMAQADVAQAQQQGKQAMAAQQPAEQPERSPAATAQVASDVISDNPQVRMQQDAHAIANDINNEGLAVQQDLTNGHITPQHTSVLFSDKSTLSKISTLFGLIVGGAGSGLAHQPNLAFEAMQKQMDRDFQGQIKSAENAQNYFRLAQENLKNQSNIQMTNTERDIRAAANARIAQNWVTLDTLVKQNAKLPEGSQARRNGDAVLAMMSDGIQKDNVGYAAKAGAAAAQARALGMLGGGSGSGGGSNSQRIMNMKVLGGDKGQAMANELETKTIDGIPEVAGQKATRPITEQARGQITAMKTLDDKTKDLFNFINQHKGMDLKRLDPKVRAVAQQKLEEVKNFYNSSIEGGALTEGRLGWYDKQFGKGAPTDILPQLFGQTDKFKEISDSNHTRMNTQLKSMGFNPKNTPSGAAVAQQQAAAQKQQAAPEEVRMVNGKSAVFNPKTKQFLRWK